MSSYFGNNPYGSLGPSPAVVMNVNQMRREPPKRKYFTYKAPGKGRDAADVIKLLSGQKLGFLSGRGYYARPGGGGAGGARGGGARGGEPDIRWSGKPAGLTDEQMIQKYSTMLSNQQKGVLDALLGDSARRGQGHLAALAGFGAALQGYSHDLWGQTNEAYRNAAAAQQSMAQGLGGQVGSGVAEARAQQAALSGLLGHSGETNLPTAEAAAAQVASEGGAKTGEMIGQVGTAWGGYGATRPEYIGFMTGQNQMQVIREQLEADADLRSKFLELGMENPATAFDMWSKMQENKRQNISTSLAQQTLTQNMQIQRAKLKQDYVEMRQRAKTAAEKAAADRWWREQSLMLDQQQIGISQQNANTAGRRAEISWYNATHPTPPKPTGYAAGNYQQKIGMAMQDVDSILSRIPKKKGALDAVFATLWPQIKPHVSAANQARARKMLRKAIGTKVAYWTPKPGSGSGAASFDDLPGA